jgi:hypothetical protein
MCIGRTFIYQGRFPWRCLLCPGRVLPGDRAFFVWAGTKLMLAHEPGTCPQQAAPIQASPERSIIIYDPWLGPERVAVDGTDPSASWLWARRSSY